MRTARITISLPKPLAKAADAKAGFNSPWGRHSQNRGGNVTSVTKVARTRCYPLFSFQDSDLGTLAWLLDKDGYGRRSFRREGRIVVERAHQTVMARILGRRPSFPAEQIDHINGTKLDCRRENLRLTTAQANAQARSRGPFSNTTRHHSGKWAATLMHNGKRFHLGLFDCRYEAGRVAAAKRKELGFTERSVA